jgi:hypothetical protein
VYTPFVRIAQFARAAHEQGKTVTPDRIPEQISAPVVYVAMLKPFQTPESAAAHTSVAAIMRPPTALPAGQSAYFVPFERRLIQAKRLVDVDEAERILGPIPLPDVVVVGVFPFESVQRSSVEFCAYRARKNARSEIPDYDVVAGFIRGPLR